MKGPNGRYVQTAASVNLPRGGSKGIQIQTKDWGGRGQCWCSGDTAGQSIRGCYSPRLPNGSKFGCLPSRHMAVIDCTISEWHWTLFPQDESNQQDAVGYSTLTLQTHQCFKETRVKLRPLSYVSIQSKIQKLGSGGQIVFFQSVILANGYFWKVYAAYAPLRLYYSFTEIKKSLINLLPNRIQFEFKSFIS